MENKEHRGFYLLLCGMTALLSVLMQRMAVTIFSFLGNTFSFSVPSVAPALFYHISGILLFGIWYYFLKEKKKGSCPFTVRSVLSLLLLGISIQFISAAFMQLIQWLMPAQMGAYQEMMQDLEQSGGKTVLMLLVLLLGPIGEEFLCRGVMLQFARRGTDHFFIANILQALLFALIHMNWVQGSYAFGAGLLLGALTYWYHSVTPAIFLHMLLNMLSFLPGFVYRISGGSLIIMVLCYTGAFLLLYCGIRLSKKEGIRLQGLHPVETGKTEK